MGIGLTYGYVLTSTPNFWVTLGLILGTTVFSMDYKLEGDKYFFEAINHYNGLDLKEASAYFDM